VRALLVPVTLPPLLPIAAAIALSVILCPHFGHFMAVRYLHGNAGMSGDSLQRPQQGRGGGVYLAALVNLNPCRR
jgi:hypothetical protein